MLYTSTNTIAGKKAAKMKQYSIEPNQGNDEVAPNKKDLDLFNREDITQFENAFKTRIDLQYFTDRPVDKKAIIQSEIYCKKFYLKTLKHATERRQYC